MIHIRLQTILLLAMCVAFACCMVLGGMSLLQSLADHRSLRAGAVELVRFQAVLDAANAVSAERGPANSAMGPSKGDAEQRVERLRAARAETDRLVSALQETFKDDIARSAATSSQMKLLSLRLAQARSAVDAVTSKPLESRTSADIVGAIERMFSAADVAIGLRDALGSAIITVTPQVSTEIMLGTAASSMREQAGRLGSFVVMMLKAGPGEDQRIVANFQKSAGRLAALRVMMRYYAGAVFPDQAMQRALADADVFYFSHALPLALRTVETQTRTNAISPAEFTDRYVPGMRYSEVLRSLIVETSISKLADLQFKALVKVLVSAALLLVISGILVLVAVILKRSLFNPLIVARQQIIAIAHGDLSEPSIKSDTSREVQDMFEGLDVLRQQQRHKRVLEGEQQRLSHQLKELSELDPLTGIMNRRAMAAHADRVFSKADAAGRWLAVLLIDIDHFKAINDTHGHAVGDAVLQKVAEQFKALLRPGDAVARFGGEEFLILLDDASDDRGVIVAERLRAHLETFVMRADLPLKVTASFGVSVRPPLSKKTWEDMVQNADRRLYAAKHGGRNQVRFTDEIGANNLHSDGLRLRHDPE